MEAKQYSYHAAMAERHHSEIITQPLDTIRKGIEIVDETYHRAFGDEGLDMYATWAFMALGLGLDKLGDAATTINEVVGGMDKTAGEIIMDTAAFLILTKALLLLNQFTRRGPLK